ncbi:Anthranilate phosphoribosyltransferase [Thioalkalivibrio nitratireducens DSM 14787]|uniref:Anthranilate phosphoribosyltransferase n=1 Tax=Thioalkalivibrio nitratireducens (strain DSM 14787 / UNIQEM 213 / ALEN2) TaxID=1255043 RepID=L0DSU6_THIND|nr:anthranilate phosphoribosyltransferase [Thioalkalivibrio nitratireducens]AGA32067.1 Anthranilate phosphoribosyltransferase [Thioalkalivibrio nitratireducens DSM 14787]
MTIQEAIAALIERKNLDAGAMTSVMRTVMTGQATPAQIGALLVALRMKGETPDEIVAAARVMRELATRVQVPTDGLVDTCGTGGDASGTFNVSTASALVAAAAGARVAKHGNRSVSSRSGSADVLESLGVRLGIAFEGVAACIERLGVGFLFAPAHHGAMRHAIGPRRELGVRTVFNVLGPLTNPAGAPNQVLGVFDAQWLRPLAEALQMLGSRHVLVVHAEDGLDEISIAAPTRVAELRDGVIREYTLVPEDLGLERAPLDSIRVDSVDASAAMIRSVLAGDPGAARDIVLMNAGAALYVGGYAASHAQGVAQAAEAIDSGAASERLRQLVELTQGLPEWQA